MNLVLSCIEKFTEEDLPNTDGSLAMPNQTQYGMAVKAPVGVSADFLLNECRELSQDLLDRAERCCGPQSQNIHLQSTPHQTREFLNANSQVAGFSKIGSFDA